jgi:hypothetical protein
VEKDLQSSSISRRRVLKHLASLPVVALGVAAAVGAADAGVQGAAQRKQLKYVSVSKMKGKTCSNCTLFKAGKTASATGGCQVIPGPISPKGYCTAWVAKAM